MDKNIFQTVNTAVEKIAVNPGAPPAGGVTYFSQKRIEELNKQQKSAEIKSAIDNIEKNERSDKLTGLVISKYVMDTQIRNAINSVCKEGKEILFTKILQEIFTKSLILDEDFIASKESVINNIITSYVKENGGFDLLETAIAHTDSNILREMRSICEETSRKVAERKMKESIDVSDPQSISFDMTDDEEKEFEYNKGKISPDEISELVKKKVFTVIKDEKTRQEENDALIKEIEEELKADDNVTDEDSAKEALNRIIGGAKPVEETTLFNALFRNAYHEYLTENIAGAQYTVQNDDERNQDFELVGDLDEDDVSRMSGDLYVSGSNAKDPSRINTVDSDIRSGREVNMDLVLAEAIASYTLMETLYTLKLEDYTYQAFKKLTHTLIHPELGADVTFGKPYDYVTTPEQTEFKDKFFKAFDKVYTCISVDDCNKIVTELQNIMDLCSFDTPDMVACCVHTLKCAKAKLNQIIFMNPNKADCFKPVSGFICASLNKFTTM